ncbi:hypothetical protein GMOD_00009240 [Pyrenophora seminiperda CCB06]|uniref:Uncharacterized protein n=1 Tax=Pyrenophora seminiperda CCB06 TaxID=1302712 RepID=A0A3M7MBX1_9PLEO|nr:hypothetical protein GMOD_00009240 [Pyrenophora seminiperda CCB06]
MNVVASTRHGARPRTNSSPTTALNSARSSWRSTQGDGRKTQAYSSKRMRGLPSSQCDNAKPKCTACVTRDSECRHSETESRQFKRKYQQLKDQRTAQEELFDLLQSMPEKDAVNIFHRIRSGANAEAVVQHIQEVGLVMELSNVPEASSRYHFPYIDSIPPRLQDSVYFQSRIFGAIDAAKQSARSSEDDAFSRQSSYAKPMLAAKMVESSLEDARISSWTNVSSNDRLLRSLLDGYFIHQYPKQFFFHKGYFLEDMIARGHEFCSPLLMNAVLAKACFTNTAKASSQLFANRTRFWDPDSLAYRFLAEAKRLWELEDREPRLTTIQAGCLINATMNDFGHDEPGFAYTRKALSLAQAMGLFAAPRGMDAKTEHAKTFTAWALASWLSLQGYYYFKPPCLLDVPVRGLPDVNRSPNWYSEISLRYQSDQKVFPMGFGHGMKALCELRVIQNEIGMMCFNRSATSRKMPWGAALHIQAKMEAWYEALPASLKPHSIFHPSHLVLHCEYHSMLMTLFKTQISATDDTTESLTNQQRNDAQNIITQSAIHLESILRIYYLRHSFEVYDTMLIIFLTHLANTILFSIEKLEQGPSDVSTETSKSLLATLVLCFKGLHDQSKNAYIASLVLAVMKDRLSDDVRNAVGRHATHDDADSESESVDESSTEQAKPIISELVLPGTNLNEEPHGWRLASLLDGARRS